MKKIITFGVAATILMSCQQSYAKETTETLEKGDLSNVENTKVTNQEEAIELLKGVTSDSKRKKRSLDTNFNQYIITQTKLDNNGYTHYTLKPQIKNVIAEDKEIKIHVDQNNEVKLINGDLKQKTISVDNKQLLTNDEAINKAFQAIGINQNDVKNIDKFKVVEKNELSINTDKKKLVFSIQINYIDPEPARWEIQVDAETGKVLKKKNNLYKASETGKGIGLNGKEKAPLNISNTAAGYTLEDFSHKGKIETLDANNTTSRANLITDEDKVFDTKKQRAGVDAHFFADEVYDYYLDTHNRESYDGKGATMTSIVHYGNKYNNAAWTGQYMIYGDGDGKQFSELSGAKDVVAHELTHAVTEKTAGLVYEYQPGALNESFSDVFGYFVDNDDWLMGEDIYTPGKNGDALRSLKDPTLYNQPEHMNSYQNLPNTEDGDWGGVHINSGIPNKAAYNTITSIGQEKAEKIYYKALTEYLTSNAQFVDAKKSLVQSAKDIYGENSNESKLVEKAWEKVGIN